MRLINLYDYDRAAAEKLPRMAYDYYASGAHDELTLRDNHAAYDRIRLRYRVLRDISQRDLGVSLLGDTATMPVLLAPTAFHRLACDEGELATARAAGSAGTILILSTLSTTGMEDVVAATTGPVWFQLYVYRDRGATEALVRRAEAAGCSAIVLTVDAQLWGVRERDVRNEFHLPAELPLPNLGAGLDRVEAASGGSGLATYVQDLFDPALSWKDLEWLAGITELPVLVKGVVHPADARLAAERGAAGIVVSNHGGRQLDTAPATIDALPDVAEAAREAADRAAGHREFAVLVDGGIRRGTDVVKAIARGADAVCVGRPVLWGLAVDGEAGATRVLEILRSELDTAMGLCGATSVDGLKAIGSEILFPGPCREPSDLEDQDRNVGPERTEDPDPKRAPEEAAG